MLCPRSCVLIAGARGAEGRSIPSGHGDERDSGEGLEQGSTAGSSKAVEGAG